MDREKIMDKVEFIDFVLKYEGQIRDVADQISKPFGATISILEEQISAICGRLEFISWYLAWSDELLVNAKFKNLPAKIKDRTEMDRSLSLEFSTSKEHLFRDWLEGLKDNTETYLSNAQSVLATKRMELSKLGYGGQ